MIHRQWHINNAIRERPAPLASSLHTPSVSSGLLHPSHLFLHCSHFVYWLRQTTLHVDHVIHGWLDALLCLGRNHIKCWLIRYKIPGWYTVRKKYSPRLWTMSYGVSWLASLASFAVNLSSATPFVLTLSFALFPLFYFTVPTICHVKRTCRQNRTLCGTILIHKWVSWGLRCCWNIDLKHHRSANLTSLGQENTEPHSLTAPLTATWGLILSTARNSCEQICFILSFPIHS